jgi:cyanophycinase
MRNKMTLKNQPLPIRDRRFTSLCALCLTCLAVIVTPEIARAQVFDERFDSWPVDLKLKGTILVCETANVSPEILKTLGDTQKQSLVLFTNEAVTNEIASIYEPIFNGVKSCELTPDFQYDASHGADVIAWHDVRSADEIPLQQLKQLESWFRAHIENGKTLLIFGPQARILSKVFIASIINQDPVIATGMNLIPDCSLETGFAISAPNKQQMLSVLASHPRCVGIGLEKNTAILFRGRKVRVLGDGQATFMLTANEHQPVRVQTISNDASSRRQPEKSLVDLTEWRRDAIDRTLEPFPPEKPETPIVDKGTLIIVGGGGMPKGLMGQFVEAAGGVENAKLVYVPCEEEDVVSPEQGMVASWKSMGVTNASFLHTKDRVRANSDEAFLAPLKDATGIWFGGGRQWNLADSYYGTLAHQMMKDVVRKGGVIGGSSAGASIQARYLARATPIENFKIMAPGYERGGLGFISGVAIDQHFTQRGRQPDMTQLVNRYPQLLGIGLDEATAITVKGSIAQVSGRGKVHFYDRTQPIYPDRPDFVALEDGQSYDLAKRQVIENP